MPEGGTKREMGRGLSGEEASAKRGIKRIRAATWIVMMIILLGSVLVWVMKPTSAYWRNWELQIRAKTQSTYFGAQGANLLIHTFPVLLYAVLGCLYLHLGSKMKDEDDENLIIIRNTKKKSCNLGPLRKPMLVKGPLGIVTGIELAFFIMFIALLVWSFSSYIHVSFKSLISPESLKRSKKTLWEAKLEWASLWLGNIGNICLVFLFFPVTRRSSVLPLFGLTSEASIKYHIWLGHITMTLFTAHGLGYIYLWVATHRVSKMLEWSKTHVSNVAGEVSLLAGVLLWATTFPRIRQQFFELFFYTHYLYIPFVVFFVFHLGMAYSSIMLPGFYLFLLDRFLRFLQSRSNVHLSSARILPCNTVELTFSKTPDLKYAPASILFINVPSISKLQWHPYTINSGSSLESEQLSIVVKSEGSWSRKLYQTVSSLPDRLHVAVEGPYGPVSAANFLRHDTLVMVSGGSGITPFISVIRELVFSSTNSAASLQKLLLVCAFKDSAGLTMLNLLLPNYGNHSPSISRSKQLQIEAYVTREKKPPIGDGYLKLVRAVRFKTEGSELPLSDVLGPNGWRWLGAIVVSSFTLYLVLMGVLTRFYIYPIDHNSYLVYPLAASAALGMTLVCTCVGAVAAGVVYWNKRQLALRAKPVLQRELVTPEPEDGQLETLLCQSIMQQTKIHYGERPDFKRTLDACKGASIGVAVCGPRKMKHAVAAICSSSSNNNLHFESISFSW